jgi:hypothetical protein
MMASASAYYFYTPPPNMICDGFILGSDLEKSLSTVRQYYTSSYHSVRKFEM